ncbi:FAD/NAD(P)-binding protein [Streptomyces sp. C10-9-1]|uniref:FAD/NAD(P)-binding protein n=1 Tax=Streptomyces sp. C10-9-1 TaxID=1859285 RepID=UPI003F4A7E1C
MTETGQFPGTPSLAFVGAGPRTTGILERIAANFDALWPGGPLRIDVVDPFPPGGGRIWRPDQPVWMLMNSRARDVTMFTDESVECTGPITAGPTLFEWAARHGAAASARETAAAVEAGAAVEAAEQRPAAPSLATEAHSLAPDSFPSRRLAGAYLAWCFRRAREALPADVEVHDHRAAAVRLSDEPDGRQRISLSDGGSLLADIVVLAQGNVDGSMDTAQRSHAAFAARCGGAHLPPGCTADVDLSALPPGADVLVSGLGLAFVDLMSLMSEGRGGRFVRDREGTVRYEPSGAEPVLWVGSRRGVPYLPKTGVRLRGADPGPVRFATVEAFKAALSRDTVKGPASGASAPGTAPDLWALTAKEVGWGYYRELFTGHPERTGTSWAAFAQVYAELDWDSPELHSLVHGSVRAADRLALDTLRTPLSGRSFPAGGELDAWMRRHVRATVDRATLPGHSPWAGAARSLFEAGNQLAELLVSDGDRLTPGAERALGRISEFNSFFSSGPPPFRLEQLMALSRAGLVRFLGAGLRVRADASAHTFTATSDSLPTERRATCFVEARLAAPDVLHGGDRLLRAMIVEGRATVRRSPGAENASRLVAGEGDYRVTEPSGRPHPRRYALGAFATGGSLGSFSVPGTNAPFFRQNDALGRRLIRQLRSAARS